LFGAIETKATTKDRLVREENQTKPAVITLEDFQRNNVEKGTQKKLSANSTRRIWKNVLVAKNIERNHELGTQNWKRFSQL
jgi:hypothetical protein